MKGYVHFVDPVPVNPNWLDNLNCVLIESLDQLKSSFKSGQYIAWDTETTGLNPDECHIVGFSYTFDGKTGYYCPVDHVDKQLGKEALDIFYKMIRLSKCSLLFNARFDMRFMEFAGYDMEPVRYIDVQSIVWLADSNISFPSLKWAEKHFLGWDAAHFEETLGSAQDFRFVKSKDAYVYACVDCLGTYCLLPKVQEFYRESGLAAKLDNDTLFIMMRLENEKQNLDREYLQNLSASVSKKLKELQEYLYKEAGYEFKIGSGRDLTQVFMKMGIDTGSRVKSGDMATSIDVIEKYLTSHPDNQFLKSLIKYKELFKQKNSYIDKLLEMSMDPHPVRFSYKTCMVPTGRLACGSDSKNTFFSKLNYQSLPKPHSHMFSFRNATDQEIRDGLDLVGYIFIDQKSERMVEGMDPEGNIRSSIKPDRDCVCISVDMSAEELRVVSNVFQESGWITAFNRGEDLHKYNAYTIFGKENYCKEYRKRAKAAAFGLLYGESSYGFKEHFPEMTMDEVEEFLLKFKRSIPNIISGQQRMIRQSRKTGTVYTYFGRPRRVKYYLQSSNPKERAFGYRTVSNCYSPDTEFLTSVGWRLAKDISESDLIAYYDNDLDQIKYCPAGKRYSNLTKESVEYSSSSIAWNVTREHRMWVRNTSKDRWRFVTSEHLMNLKSYQAVASSVLSGGSDDSIRIGVNEYNRLLVARFLGWMITYGCIHKKDNRNESYCLDIIQVKDDYKHEILELFSSFGFKYYKFINDNGKEVIRMSTYDKKLYNWCLSECSPSGLVGKSNYRIPEWVFDSSLEVRRGFIDSVIKADGTCNNDYSGRVFTANFDFASDLNRLLVLSGFSSKLKLGRNSNGNIIYSVYFNNRRVFNCDNRRNSTKIRRYDQYQEFSCFSVPSQILVTRYKGCVSFHGNTVVQGAAADILKLILCRLWREVFKPYQNKVRFMGTIHDEVTFSVPRSLVSEVLPIIVKCMTINIQGWPVTLECSISIGYDFGSLFPFKYNSDGVLEPEYEIIEQDKDLKQVEPEVVNEDFELQDSKMFEF